MRSGIYKITNEITGKFYIGSSEDVDYRWEVGHKQALNRNQHCNPRLQYSWNFYGADKFTMIIIETVDPKKELLLEREQHYLDTFKPYIQGIGYNICPTASGGDNITYNPNRDAFIKKMRGISMGENNPMFGRKHTQSSIKKQKMKAVGRYTLDWFIFRYGIRNGKKKFNERRKMLINRKINYSFDNKLSGKKRGPMSEEIKQRISERKQRMKSIRNDLHNDILSNKMTIPQIERKYEISKTTILRERRKLNS